jgi:arylsulfatase A-like enzyme
MNAVLRPNILFIISDQHRWDTNGFAGHPVVSTPNLDALAARGVQFDNAYYANVTYLDSKVGLLLSALERLGLADRTIVVYTTDHGEMLFDHGMVQKQNFFEGSTHVPLLFHVPGTAGGRREAGLVSLLDLLPTFCELADVEAPHGLEGDSLAPCLTGRGGLRDRSICSEYYSWGFAERMIRRGDWKYMYAHGRPCQLYNLAADPHEQTNVVDSPDCRPVRDTLHAELMADWELPPPEELANLQGAWNDRAEWYVKFEEWCRQRGGTRESR